jgi:undecaprenyl phosphate-alpha-L-ara4N flippase subunit ArnE
MNAAEKTPRPLGAVVRNFALGIGCLTAWFFLWLGLLGQWELSRLFPFEGLNPALLLIGAWLVLKEKVPPSAWLGIVLISTGIALVAAG